MKRGVHVLEAADAALAHFFIRTYVIVGELLAPHQYVETHSQHTQAEQQSGNYDGGSHINR
jgi:hypothetical protein